MIMPGRLYFIFIIIHLSTLEWCECQANRHVTSSIVASFEAFTDQVMYSCGSSAPKTFKQKRPWMEFWGSWPLVCSDEKTETFLESVFFSRLFFFWKITPNFSETIDGRWRLRQPLRLQDPLCSGVCSQRKVASKKSGRLPCSERWWPFSWCWAAQGFSDPKRGPRMDASENLSGWNCDWRTQVAVTVPSWKGGNCKASSWHILLWKKLGDND